jgi:hypothetical protein
MINKEFSKNVSKLSVAALLAAGSMSANAFEIENDGWTFSLHGNVNANVIYSTCDSGGATVDGAFLCTGSGSDSAVSNAYLPTTFDFGLATTRNGYDITVHSAFDRGLDTNEAFNVGSGGDEGFRIWMTIGNDDMGTVTLGRDWGLFALDSTFQEQSVYGVGGPLATSNPTNTTFGAAGTGYIFLDRLTGITWTLPTSDTWVAQVGILQPLNISSFSSGAFSGAETGSEGLGYQGRLRYNFDNGFVSTSFNSYDVDATAGAVNADFRTFAYDVTGQVSFGDLQLTGTYYDSDGAGHSGLLIDAVDPTGDARQGDGYYVQALYTAGATKYGVNYGMTNVDAVAADAGTMMEEKSKITFGVYHSLTSGMMINAEVSKVEAENKAGGEVENDVFSIGAFFFF